MILFTPFFQIKSGFKNGDLIGWKVPSGSPPYECWMAFAMKDSDPFGTVSLAEPTDLHIGFSTQYVLADTLANRQQREFLLSVQGGGDGGPGPLAIPTIFTSGITGVTEGLTNAMPLTVWRPTAAALIEVETGNATNPYGFAGVFPPLIKTTTAFAITESTPFKAELTLNDGAWQLATSGDYIRGYFIASVPPHNSGQLRVQIEVVPANVNIKKA